MIVLLWALSGFNLFAGIGGVGLGLRLMTQDERAHWQSVRLLTLAEVFAWVLPLVAAGGTGLAWTNFVSGRQVGALLAFLPIGWMVLMGLVFAVVDFAEDGILGNARR